MIRVTGGQVAYTKVKTRYVAELSIDRFLAENSSVWFLTFTEPGRVDGVLLWNKTEAELHLKPFLDYLRRRGAEFLLVWEMQKRGAWHPHILVNKFVDVNWARPWMMQRGWGQQMRFELVKRNDGRPVDGRVRDYICKSLRGYLLKARTDDMLEPRKKFFGGTARSKCGNIKFAWNPATDTAHSFLYYYGRNLFTEIYQTSPSHRDLPIVMQLGLRDRNWLDCDFLYEPPYS